MALKNQVANVYGVGINNVGSYQVAGRPFCMTGSVSGEDEITFPQVTKRWWTEEFAELSQKQRDEVKAETQAAYKLAKERGERFKS